MFKRYKKTLIITSILILLPVAAGLILWNRLPDTMAIHWGSDGEPNGWSGKFFAVVGIPLFLLGCQWLCAMISFADPKKQNLIGSKTFQLVLCIIPAVALICQPAVMCEALGVHFPFDRVLPVFLGVLFILIGNWLPKCRQSYTMGIKLPWTLADEENWRRTHRLAGVVWVIGGVLCVISGLLKVQIVMVAAFIAMIAIPTIYSYVIFKKSRDE